MTVFYNITRRLLDEKLAIVRGGAVPKFTDLRHFFYECRNKFLRENPQFTEIDGKDKNKYAGYLKIITKWCVQHSSDFGFDKSLWWRVREKLNIWAKGKATCGGEVEKFLIDRDTRNKVSHSCSFVLLCEKETVSRELLERLRGEGYKLNIVATAGQNTSDVKEAILETVGELDEDEPTFYFLALHDYDASGLEIYFDLKKRYANVIDVGVNRDFFRHRNFDLKMVEEQVKNKGFHDTLKGYITDSSTYSAEDFEYLQGRKEGKTWIGKRIEIDAIHVAYGIEPFVTYIMDKIAKECNLWDLSRIGVTEFGLPEPPNPFHLAVTHFEHDISKTVNESWSKISKPMQAVDELVKSFTSDFGDDWAELLQKHSVERDKGFEFGDGMSAYTMKNQKLTDLKERFKKGFDKTYKPEFESALQEINDQVTKYEGDVREGAEDLRSQADDLQKELEAKINDDEEAKELSVELGKIDWGKEEFEALKVPDEKDVIKHVIERLEERLDELEAEKE